MKNSQIRNSTALMAAVMAVTASGAAGAQQGSDKVLHDSERMIARCLDHAAGQKYPPLSVGILDASGTLIAFKRQDGASAASADAALLKARTSLRIGAATVDLGPATADAPTRDAFLILQMTTLPGGAPIALADGSVIGAVGVSGGLAEQDAECARQAVTAPVAKKK